MRNRWGDGPPDGADALDRIAHLSNLVGAEESLVQPGGGNSSIKVTVRRGDDEEEMLLVKGSGTDLRTIQRAGFTQLSMASLANLRERTEMSDEQMMEFMRGCMLDPGDPAPSVETPLHSILPYRVIVHTHDVATMSLTNLKDERAEKLVGELFEGEIFYVPYVRPGFPLARSVVELAPRIPEPAGGLALAHHGLVVWGDDARECYARLLRIIDKAEEHLAACKRGRQVLGRARVRSPDPELRRNRAALLLPVIRGELAGGGESDAAERVILHFDDSSEILERLAAERCEETSQRGMATPEHILRAGRLPLWLTLDLAASEAEPRLEQVEFLRRLVAADLPVSDRSQEIVRDILLLEQRHGCVLRGKTGSGFLAEDRALGWFVGYLTCG